MRAFGLQRRIAALLGCNGKNGRCAGSDASSGGCSEKVEGLVAACSRGKVLHRCEGGRLKVAAEAAHVDGRECEVHGDMAFLELARVVRTRD